MTPTRPSGTVDRVSPASRAANRYSFPYEIIHHSSGDPYAARHQGSAESAHQGMLEATQLTMRAIASGKDVEDPKSNPGLQEALRRAPSLRRWFAHTNSDLSLYFLYYPEEGQLVPGIPLPDDLRDWSNLPIGIGLRERAAVFRAITLAAVRRRAGTSLFTQLVAASGNGRHPLMALRDVNQAECVDFRLWLLDNNREALGRAHSYATEMEIANQVQLVDGDLFSVDGIMIRGIGQEAVLGGAPAEPRPFHQTGLPQTFALITDSGATGCYMPEDTWLQTDDISSFKEGPSRSKLRPGQVSLKRALWSHVAPGGSYVFDSVNLVNPNDPPGTGRTPLLDYLRHVVGWKGLVPATVHGDHGLEGEFGILPMLDIANLDGLTKVVVHTTAHGVFNCYELIRSRSDH